MTEHDVALKKFYSSSIQIHKSNQQQSLNMFSNSFSSLPLRLFSVALEQQDCHLIDIEIDETAFFMCDERTERASSDAVPSGLVFIVELLFDIRSDVLLN